MILRFRQTDRDIFEAVRTGKKSLETRAATIKFQNIKKGDVLVFVCGKERFERKVKKVRHFKSAEDMFKAVNYKKILPWAGSAEELKKVYSKFPGYKEKIKKFGLVVLYLCE